MSLSTKAPETQSTEKVQLGNWGPPFRGTIHTHMMAFICVFIEIYCLIYKTLSDRQRGGQKGHCGIYISGLFWFDNIQHEESARRDGRKESICMCEFWYFCPLVAINHIRKPRPGRHKSCKLGSNVDTAINQSACEAKAQMQQLIR